MKKYLRMNERTIGITAGARYEVIEEDARTYRFIDDDGDSRTWSKEREGEFFMLEVEFSAPISGVTALPDETLGGILREYREVKREARVGELVKITEVASDGYGFFSLGNVGSVTRYGSFGLPLVDFTVIDQDGYDGSSCDGQWYVGGSAGGSKYVVLEPTDIIRVGDERLRMVDRKATVGERVIVTNPDGDAEDHGDYRVGDIGTIASHGSDTYGGFERADMSRGFRACLYSNEYRVVEPVRELGQDYDEFIAQVDEIPELSSRPAADQIAENIAALTAKVQALEAAIKRMNTQLRVAREDIVLIEDGVADDIAELRDKVAALEKAQYNTPQPVYAIPRMSGKTFPVALKTPQQVRDEIVERAKADVKALLSRNYPDAIGWGVWFAEIGGTAITDECEFVVDRDKRAVVALIRELESGKKSVILRGIAKCAPNDVFNAHIGRAISLRRALGLEIPAEYLSVPAPEIVREGDIVDYGGRVATVALDGRNIDIDTHTFLSTANECGAKIIDDTREGAELSASSAEGEAA